MRLNLGSGPVEGERLTISYPKKDGWINVDMFPYSGVDVVVNLETDDIPFKSDSAEEIQVIDLLEHLTGPRQVPFLKEVFRVLQYGGKAVFQLPDLGEVCRVYCGLREGVETDAQYVALIFNGPQNTAGEFHQWAYDKKSLVATLMSVGFVIEWCEPFGIWFNMACVAWKGEIRNA